MSDQKLGQALGKVLVIVLVLALLWVLGISLVALTRALL